MEENKMGVMPVGKLLVSMSFNVPVVAAVAVNASSNLSAFAVTSTYSGISTSSNLS